MDHGRQIRVLLVDDEEDFLSPTSKVLSRRGCETTTATSGEQALEILEKISKDVVVLDVKMPGMGGIPTLREIRKSYPGVEVIMLTAHANLEVALEGMRLGAFDYLMKPADIDELLYKIQDAYKAKSIQEEKIAQLEKAID